MRRLIWSLVFPWSHKISSTYKNRTWAHIIIFPRKPAMGSKSLQYSPCSSPIGSVPHISTSPGPGGRQPICTDKWPAPCHASVYRKCTKRVEKMTCIDIFKCGLKGFTTSGCHSARGASSTFKQYWNGRTHFAQSFRTRPSIGSAIFAKQTRTFSLTPTSSKSL